MQQHDPNREQERPEPASYEPPRIEQSAEFETLALQCGRTPGSSGCYYSAEGYWS